MQPSRLDPLRRLPNWGVGLRVLALFVLAAGITAHATLLLTTEAYAEEREEKDDGAAPRTDAPSDKGEDKRSLDERSLEFRARLQQYPTQDALFARLLEMYQKAGEVDRLVGMYRQHTTVYPNDEPGRIVYVRLLSSINDPEAANQVRESLRVFPKSGYLHYLLYEHLKEAGDPKAIDALDKAVEFGTDPRARAKWIEKLLKLALEDDRRDVAKRHVETMIQIQGPRAEGKVRAARRLASFGLHEKALDVLTQAAASEPSPELIIDIELLSAVSEISLHRSKEARDRLDNLLARLTADHWRRSEVLTMRQRLIASEGERDAMLAEARKNAEAHPNRDTASLDWARMLRGFDRHREALTVLLEASERMPESAQLEKETLDVFDHLGDVRRRVKYLKARIAKYPGRDDLVDRHIRALFLLRRTKDAVSMFDEAIAGLAEHKQVSRLLDMARFLRGNNRPKPSVTLFMRALDLAPERAAVLRELGEMLRTQRDRAALHRLLVRPIPDAVGNDEFLDLMNFMLEAGHFRQAERALMARHAKQPEHFALGLALLKVRGYLIRPRSGAKLVLDLRRLADSPSRYRRWLTLATDFAASYAESATFLEQEQVRLLQETGAWNAARVDRIAAFLDVNARRYRITEARHLVDELLAGELPPDVALSLRRHLALHLERNSRHALLAGEELESLIEDDSDHREEYKARLALVYLDERDYPRAEKLLEALDVSKVGDAELLARLARPFRQLNDHDRLLDIYDRLTQAEPNRRSNWEQWITTLVAVGDEAKLRRTLRRLLRGIPRMPVSNETRTLLRDHLADSHWRGISAAFQKGGEGELIQALTMLDRAERLYPPARRPLWQSWSRIYALGRLGRLKAKADALHALKELRELQRVTEAKADSKIKSGDSASGEVASTKPSRQATLDPSPEWVTFPDGLAASWQGLERMADLSHEVSPSRSTDTNRETRRTPQGTGPAGADRIRWVFKLFDSRPTALLGFGETRLLATTSGGALHCVDRVSGKLQWSIPGSVTGDSQLALPSSTRVALVRGPHVECYDESGDMVWRVIADHGPVHIAASPHGLIVFDAYTEEVTCLNPGNGKVRWWHELGDSSDGTHAANSGLSVQGEHILAFGKHTYVLDARDGRHLWRFDPTMVRSVPVELKEPERQDGRGRGLLSMFGSSFFGGGSMGMGGPVYGAPWSSSGFYSSGLGMSCGAACGGSCGSSVRLGSSSFLSPSVTPVYMSTSFGMPPPAWSASSSQSTLHPVATVAHWGSPLSGNQKRIGILEGGSLLLFRDSLTNKGPANGTLTVASVREPFRTRVHEHMPGVYLGKHQEHLVFLSDKGITRLHPRTGNRRLTAFEKDFSGKQPVRAVLRGGYVFAAGDERIVSIHMDSGTTIADVPWPEALAASQEEDYEETVDAWGRTRKKRKAAPQFRYLFRGVVNSGASARSRLAMAQHQARMMTMMRRGYRMPYYQPYFNQAPTPSANPTDVGAARIMFADDSALYTTHAYNEIVAFEHATPTNAERSEAAGRGKTPREDKDRPRGPKSDAKAGPDGD